MRSLYRSSTKVLTGYHTTQHSYISTFEEKSKNSCCGSCLSQIGSNIHPPVMIVPSKGVFGELCSLTIRYKSSAFKFANCMSCETSWFHVAEVCAH